MLWLVTLFAGIATLVLNRPLLDKPLVVDEGNWFYLTMFHDRGVRQFYETRIPNPLLRSKCLGYHTHGYCNLEHYALFFSWLFKNKSVRFFQAFKTGILCCAAMSVTLLAGVITQSVSVALCAGLMFALVTATPETLFCLTYAEFAQISSVNLAVLLGWTGFDTQTLWLLLPAGLFAAQTVQFKPTGWLFVAMSGCILCGACMLGLAPWAALLWATAGFAALMLWPLLWLWSRQPHAAWTWQPARYYLHYTLRYPLQLGLRVAQVLCHHMLARWCRPSTDASRLSAHPADYTLTLLKKSQANKVALLKRYLGPTLSLLWPFPVLGLGQLLSALPQGEPATWLLLGLCCLYLGVETLQQAYFTPHFGPFWSPICILAAMTLAMALPLWHTPYGAVVLLVTAYALIRSGRAIANNFKPQAATRFSGLSLLELAAFSNAEHIGQNIRLRSAPQDKLLVIGDAPHMYIHAQRECLHPSLLFLYHPRPRLTPELFFISIVRSMPPEWILWYDWRMVEDWNIARVQDTTGIVYHLVENFPLRDPESGHLLARGQTAITFPLYRRDDAVYTRRLLARAAAQTEAPQARCWLGAAATVAARIADAPLAFECALRLELLEVEPMGATAAATTWLRKAHTPAELATAQMVLAELAFKSGDRDNAQALIEGVELTGDARPETLLAELAYARGKKAQAIRHCSKALQIDAWYAEAHNALGVIMLEAGKTEDAEVLFEKALRYHPENPIISTNLAVLWGEETIRHYVFYLCANFAPHSFPFQTHWSLEEARTYARSLARSGAHCVKA